MPRFSVVVIKAACTTGDLSAIADLSVSILTALRDRERERERNVKDKKLEGRGPQPPGTLDDSDAVNFAYRMLRACQRARNPPPEVLVDLFQILMHQDRPPQSGETVELQQARAFSLEHPEAGVRKIARQVGVNASTVTRWKQGGLLR